MSDCSARMRAHPSVIDGVHIPIIPVEEKYMNKGEFVEALAKRLEVSRAQADRSVTAVLELISAQLAKGNKVAFTGFGSFEVAQRAARTGRNPQTGATIKIAAAKVPKFSAGATLKNVVSGKAKPAKPAAKKAPAKKK